jgi:hypothetical protein
MFRSALEKVIVGVLTAVALSTVYFLWDTIRKFQTTYLIPPGAVMAFSIDCPAGSWRHFTEANGRFIVGAGDKVDPTHGTWQQLQPNGASITGVPLAVYQVGASGGEQMHLLAEKEMPRHGHNLFSATEGTSGNTGQNAAGWWGRSGSTENNYKLESANDVTPSLALSSLVGGGEAHNTLPVYYALNYCVKL